MTDYLDLTVRELLESVAAPTPAPGAGSTAAVVAGLAAGLAAMAAGLSTEQLPDAEVLVERARAAQATVAPLAQQDADAYAGVLEALGVPRSDPDRGAAVRRALQRASDVPLEVATAASDVVAVADRVARDGNPRLHGDALTAGLLARAVVRATVTLVGLNLPDADDPRRERARALADAVPAQDS